MVIIGMMSYPPEALPEVMKRLSAQSPLPEGITMRGPYGSSRVGEGMKSITIYEIDQSKIAEAMIAIGKRYQKYFGVPGLTHSIELWVETADALKVMEKTKKSR